MKSIAAWCVTEQFQWGRRYVLERNVKVISIGCGPSLWSLRKGQVLGCLSLECTCSSRYDFVQRVSMSLSMSGFSYDLCFVEGEREERRERGRGGNVSVSIFLLPYRHCNACSCSCSAMFELTISYLWCCCILYKRF